jgi:hypothetical protein
MIAEWKKGKQTRRQKCACEEAREKQKEQEPDQIQRSAGNQIAKNNVIGARIH